MNFIWYLTLNYCIYLDRSIITGITNENNESLPFNRSRKNHHNFPRKNNTNIIVKEVWWLWTWKPVFVPYIVCFPDISSFIRSVIASCRSPYISRYFCMWHIFHTMRHDMCYHLIFALYVIVSVIAPLSLTLYFTVYLLMSHISSLFVMIYMVI
jgi:hypothetical protein